MPFRFNCENCDVRIKVPDGSEGKKVKCPSCGQAQRVPGTSVAAPVVPATAAAIAQPARAVVRQPVVATSATPPKVAAKSSAAAAGKTKPGAAPRAPRETAPVESARPQATELDAHDALAALAAAGEPEPVAAPVRSKQVVMPDAVVPPAVIQPLPTTASATSEKDSDAGSASDSEQLAAHEQEALRVFLATTEPNIEVADTNVIDVTESVPHLTTPTAPIVHLSHLDAPVGEAAELQVNSTSQTSPPDSRSDVIDSTATDSSPSEPMQMSISMDALFGPTAAAPPSATGAVEESADDEPVGRSISASEVGEAPAGEVRDLFDDFVRRETIEREAESNSKPSAEVAAMEPAPSVKVATRSATARAAVPVEPSAEPTPVVVAKTPIRVTRGGGAAKAAVVVKDVAVETSAPADETDALAAAAAAIPIRRAPQAIPLSAPPPQVPALSLTETVDSSADVELPADPDPVQAVAMPPMAKPRRVAPAPSYSLLIVLCWALRLLACLSLASVVKLTLMALDAGYKTLDVAIIAPLGLGVAAGIWAVGEVARVARDSARNSHR